MTYIPKSDFIAVMMERGFLADCTDYQGLDDALLQGVQPGRFKETLGPRLCALGYLIDSVDQFVDVPWIDTE